MDNSFLLLNLTCTKCVTCTRLYGASSGRPHIAVKASADMVGPHDMTSYYLSFSSKQGVQFADLPYFVGLATLTIYIGAHRGLSARNRQQLSMQQVCFSAI